MARKSKSIEYLKEKELRENVRASNTARQFGFMVQHAERGKVTMRMPVNARHKQVHGVVHGGVLAALADTAGGLAT
jgi:acyl-coenzyme A thioesterase PaaI-like protein